MFTDLYLYIEDMKERIENPNQYISILNLEQELIEMSELVKTLIISDFKVGEINKLPF